MVVVVDMNKNYKSYQRVIDVSKKIGKPKNNIKRVRTKSGCLTCRKRKKKCDEDVVSGKCQGCTRNFLECCWPSKIESDVNSSDNSVKESNLSDNSNTSDNSENHSDNSDSESVNDSLSKVSISNLIDPIPYPSPLPSPRLEKAKLFNDNDNKTKNTNNTKNNNNANTPKNNTNSNTNTNFNKFIITSLDNNSILVNL